MAEDIQKWKNCKYAIPTDEGLKKFKPWLFRCQYPKIIELAKPAGKTLINENTGLCWLLSL